MIYLVIQHQTAPYTQPSDNFLALAASFSLAILYFSCILLKLGLNSQQLFNALLDSCLRIILANFFLTFRPRSGEGEVLDFVAVALSDIANCEWCQEAVDTSTQQVKKQSTTKTSEQ